MPNRVMLLDACVAINLAATDHWDAISEVLGHTLTLTRQAAEEVGQLREVINDELVVMPIPVRSYLNRGTLTITDLLPDEYSLYVDLAALVDEGEASTIAAAAFRNVPLATDDRKARRLCQARKLPEPHRTLALLRTYADAALGNREEIQRMLDKVRRRASYLPARSDPDYKWWCSYIPE